jgi:sulfite exporter TauE/SafE
MTGDLLLIATSGLLGSAHCVGMCGGFAVLVGIPVSGAGRLLVRQLTYSAGRIVTYSMLGGIAGYAGVRLTNSSLIPGAVNVAAVLSILCGLFLIVEGAIASGFTLFRRAPRMSFCDGCGPGSIFSAFLRSPGWHHAFLAGLLTGFLPCGLVYGFLALAAAERDPLRGMAVMAAFGVGTVPLMVCTGLGSRALSAASRRRLLRIAAVCVVLTGGLTVFRGYGFLRSANAAPACPFCTGQAGVHP